MKDHMNAHRISRHILYLALSFCLAVPLSALAASVTLATAPLATSSNTTVQPNIMFMLDDSGSMDWDYMPDDSKNFAGMYGYETNHCNGVYYNPSITYTAPLKSDGTSYPDASFTAAWRTGYNTGAGTVNLDSGFTGGSGSGSSGINLTPGPAFYYTYSGTQTAGTQMDFHNTASVFYKECNSAIGSTTKVDGVNPVNTVFKKVRLASSNTTTITVTSNATSTITVSGSSTTTVTHIKVNGIEILNATTGSSKKNTSIATNIMNGINACSTAVTGNCVTAGGTGFSATVSGNVVTLFAPSTAGGYTPAITCGSCGMTFAATAIPTVSATTVSSIKVNGVELLLSGPTASTNLRSTMAANIAAGINATGYSATVTSNVVTITGPVSASTYTPVITYSPTSGGLILTTDAFPESTPAKLKNFANWYSYYSNRMLMMKTGVGQAFAPINDKYRVGFMTMNNNVSPDIVDIAPFVAGCTVGSGTCQRDKWYTKLYAATPGNSTPLREALSHVGQLYAHKFGSYDTYTATITVGGSGSTVVDSVTVNGTETMAATSLPSTSTSTVAANIANQINALDPSDYGASVSGNVITITGPKSALSALPNPNDDGGGMTFNATSFVKNTIAAQLNGILPADPVQYSCQQNFVILSTDGYWNGSTTYDLSTPNKPVGNQDTLAPRPMYDGGQFTKTTSQTYQKQIQITQTISQLQKRTTQIQSSTSNLQTQTSQLQTQTSQLQKSTSQLTQSTSQVTQSTSQVTQSTSQLTKSTSSPQSGSVTLQGTVSQVLMKCTGTSTQCGSAPTTGVPGGGTAGHTWSVVTSCTSLAGVTYCSRVAPTPTLVVNVTTTCNTSATISNSSPYTTSNTDGGYKYSSCAYTTPATWSSALSSCTDTRSTANPNTTLTATQCQYMAWSSATPTGTCTAAAQGTTGPGNTIATATTCPTVTTGPTGVASCTPATAGAGNSYTATTCNTGTTGPTGVASCTPAMAGAGNSYTTTTCNTVTTGPTPVASCTAAPAGSGNSYTATTCPTVTTGPTGVASCTAAAAGAGNSYTATTCNTAITSAWAGTSACTANTTPDSSGYTTQCQTAVTSAYSNAASCTTTATPDGSGNTTQCQYTPWSTYANASTCTAVAQSAASPYTVGTATQCQTTDTGWVGATSCTNSGPTNGQTVYCPNPNPVVTGPTPVDPNVGCTSQTAGPGNNYVNIACTTNSVQPSTLVGTCVQGNSGAPSYIQTSCTTTQLTSSGSATSCNPGNSGPPSYIQTTCTSGTGGTSDTLADVAMYYYQTDLRDTSLANCTGSMGLDVCENNVFVNPYDNNVKQHLTTYTLGLGARGRMVYSSKNYMNDTSGDFYSVKTGATANLTSTPPVCSWQAAGTVCNWPIPASGSINNIDDLWHAAVNGRGTYFSATDPAALADGLSSALSSISARKGAAAAAATSTLNPVANNNYAYVASYTTVQWTGNLEARTINTDTGVVAKNASWCVENLVADTCVSPNSRQPSAVGNSTVYLCEPQATSLASNCISPNVFDTATNKCGTPMVEDCTGTLPPLVSATSDNRKIKTPDGSGGLVDFYYANLSATQKTYFGSTVINGLSQWPALTTTQQTAAAGTNLVNFLRGQTGYEDRPANLVGTVDNRIYRFRPAVMGDALESQPTFIAAPTFSYADLGYKDFSNTYTGRAGTVILGTNDGMVHGFDGQTGVERFAYVPSMVIPNMWKLADKDYGTKHVNFINGSPVISDFCAQNCDGVSGTPDWRTILVGGLNGGGRGYYALDITDPTDPAYPKLLWEFTPTQDANLGYTFGVPVVTKLSNGTWVVLVTSGYDNGTLSGDGVTANSPTGDGQGYLYVLNAKTGAIIRKINTGAGSPATPSGLAKIAAWNGVVSSNQASYVYGGDLLGNVWRFDINLPTSTTNPLLFATLKDGSGNAQPITTTPILGLVNGYRVIYVGTGKYLEVADLSNPAVQSLYAIKDDDATYTLVNPRSYAAVASASKMVQQTITPNGYIRSGSTSPVDFTAGRGWFIDFPDTGERVNIDGQLVMGALIVPTIVPSSTVCSPGGYGWFNFFDYSTGQPIQVPPAPGMPVNMNVSVKYDSPIVGINILYIGGNPVFEVVTADNPTPERPPGIPQPPNQVDFTGKRMQWRELMP